MQNLVLYIFESCPFCKRVMKYIDKNNIKLEIKDTIEDYKAKQELMKLAGKTQVPCLVIDGKPLFESVDIINWFEKNRTIL